MNSKLIKISLTLFLITTLTATAASFLKIEGIDGECKDTKHRGWIDITPVVQTKEGGGMPTGRRTFKPLTLSKRIDKASPMLASALASGTPLRNLQISQNGHVTVLKSAYVISITKDRKGNELVTFSEEPAGGAGTRATDYNSSRSNKEGIAHDQSDDDDDGDSVPTTYHKNKYAP